MELHLFSAIIIKMLIKYCRIPTITSVITPSFFFHEVMEQCDLFYNCRWNFGGLKTTGSGGVGPFIVLAFWSFLFLLNSDVWLLCFD